MSPPTERDPYIDVRVSRGEVYLADLDPIEGSEQSGQRPVVVVSRDSMNRNRSVVVVVPITTLRAGRKVYPHEIILRAPDGGLKADSLALVGQIRTISKSRIQHHNRWGTLSKEALAQICKTLFVVLDAEQ